MTITDVRFRLSNNGVPHIIIEADGQVYSACWFNKTKKWKLWEDYHKTNKKVFSGELEPGESLSFDFMLANKNRNQAYDNA